MKCKFKNKNFCCRKMVVVANEPVQETEPMLGAAGSSDDIVKNVRKNSYAEEAYKNITR